MRRAIAYCVSRRSDCECTDHDEQPAPGLQARTHTHNAVVKILNGNSHYYSCRALVWDRTKEKIKRVQHPFNVKFNYKGAAPFCFCKFGSLFKIARFAAFILQRLMRIKLILNLPLPVEADTIRPTAKLPLSRSYHSFIHVCN